MNSRPLVQAFGLLAVAAGMIFGTPASCQSPGQLGPAPGRAVQAVDKLADLLDSYYSKNKVLPSTEPEMDKFLVDNYEPVIGNPIPSQAFPKPNRNARTLLGIAMWIDPRVTNLAKINNLWQFPSDWASPEALSIVTDGRSNYVVFLANQQGKPATNIYKVGQLQPPVGGAGEPPKPVSKTDGNTAPKTGDFDFGLGKPAGGSILSPE